MLRDRMERRPVITHRIAVGINGRPPKSLDHFQVTSVELRDKHGPHEVDQRAHDELVRLGYGKAPKRVPIRVDSDDIDDFLLQQYESRASLPATTASGAPRMVEEGGVTVQAKQLQVWCSGDGVTARRLGKGGLTSIRCCASPSLRARDAAELGALLARKVKHDPDDGGRCPWAQNTDAKAFPTCKPNTTLLCRCDAVANVGAMARYHSTSYRSADALRSSFEAVKAKIPGGRLRDVPLDLVCMMREVAAPNGRKSLKPIVHVELRLSVDDTIRLIEANLQVSARVAEAHAAQAKMLQAARAESATVDDAEFHQDALRVLNTPPSGGLGDVVDMEKT